MEILLKQDIAKLGFAGDVVKVKDGYARNFLLPKRLAVGLSKASVKQLDHERRIIEQAESKKIKAIRESSSEVAAIAITIKAKTVEDSDALYGSVGASEVFAALEKKGVEIKASQIEMPEPIREIGSYKVKVRLHKEVAVEIAVDVISE